MVLTEIQRNKLFDFLSKLHPYWVPKACRDKTLWFETELCAQLQPLLLDWLQTGVEREYVSGMFSIRKIMALCGVDYLTALERMDLYLKDPQKGMNSILPF